MSFKAHRRVGFRWPAVFNIQFHGAKNDTNVLFCPINSLLHSFISMREKGKVHLGS